MISFTQALEIIQKITCNGHTEKVTLSSALNRILAEDVVSDTDMPPFDKAAMDGYACHREDLGNELTVIGEMPAGNPPAFKPGRNECVKIMTGAVLPEGTDYILIREHASVNASGKIVNSGAVSGSNICRKGEDIRAGDILVEKGTRLLPPHITVLGAGGCTEPRVTRMPSVAVISTGNELIPLSEFPAKGKIRETNGLQLCTQTFKYGIPARDCGIVPDDKKLLHDAIGKAIDENDLIILTGGVSVGDYDYIPEILQSLGVEILFRGVKIKPGKHMILGRRENHFIAALPGNPVSAFVLFEIFIKPLLNRIMGCRNETARLLLNAGAPFSRARTDLYLFIPVKISADGSAIPVDYHGSAHIHAYTGADGIMEVPEGVSSIIKGDKVHVRPI